MGEWQPVETAPTDGTHLLLYFDGKAADAVGMIEGWWFSSPKRIDDGWETIFGGVGDPVMWMPLPSPPP